MAGQRVYLLGPSTGTPGDRAARFGAALDALRAAGCEVVAPGLTADAAGDLVADVAADMDALTAADVVVTLPGAEGLWEYALAAALGLRVVAYTAREVRRSA
ncbi:DUF4406 domain-containing protein [Micromonospora okii]|uniref:DUF4406 domain-containing protein n=1 Tax=Micromonospora okii TaxID=1182970 RepID=UPI001E5E886F|nr:DUF4406 domain-containing protein [Micromonospora okii]